MTEEFNLTDEDKNVLKSIGLFLTILGLVISAAITIDDVLDYYRNK